MIRTFAVAIACLIAVPAFAQTPAAGNVDAAAIVEFDPEGGSGVPLTKEIIRTYLGGTIVAPTRGEERAAAERVRVAKAAKRVLLANETLFAPLWEEQAFELQDGSVRPMTPDEKAVLRELDEASNAQRALNARRLLAAYAPSERSDLAEALCALLDAGVRIADRGDGYRKDGDNWLWFDWDGDRIVGFRKPDPEVEIALLRYELVQARIMRSAVFRAQALLSVPPSPAPF